MLFDKLQAAVDVFGGFRVEGDDAGASFGKIRNDAVDRLHHQVDVDRRGNTVVTQRLQHHRANRQVRHVVVVHDVEVHDIRTRRQRLSGILTQTGKISRQNRRGNQILLHPHLLEIYLVLGGR